MLIANGTKLLICHRRLYEADHPRYFFGIVSAYADGVARVSGFTWTRDATRGFQRKADRRTKLISLASGNLLVYVLPEEVAIEDIRVEQPGGHVVGATDGGKFRMDLSERL